MAFKYTRAETVAVGEKVTSRKFAAQARARNDRYRHGVGSPAWRHHFWHFNLGRMIRCPEGVDGCGSAFPVAGIGAQYPSMGEWMEFYMHVTNEAWPDAPPGTEGGVNPASAIGAYVHGVGDVLAEVDRLSCNPLASLEAECPQGVPTLLPGYLEPQTLEEYWELGLMQRGGTDLAAGRSAARMLDSAVSYWGVLMGFTQLHHKCFGGYVPQPEDMGGCGDGGGLQPQTRDLKIFFTPIDKGPLTKKPLSYEGTCPPIDGDARPKHIRVKVETPRAWYILLNDGTLNILSKKDYVEGPYSGGGRYIKLDGGQLVRVMNGYLAQFRGSDDQRIPDLLNRNIAKTGYPFRKLLRSQYFGAPNRGTWNATTGKIDVDVPLFRVTGASGLTIAAGTAVGGTYANADGFVTGGLWAKATKLAKPVTVRVMNGETVMHAFTLNPGQATPEQAAALATGEAQYLHFFEEAQQGKPVRVVLGSELAFTDSSGELAVETNEVLSYKPELDDIFLLLRLAVSHGDEGRIGNEVADANEIWEDWLKYGCVAAGGLVAEERGAGDGGTFEAISDNKFHETARRLVRRTTRLYTRESLVGYEVSNGKSVLYLRRYNRGLDQMDGLAPALTPVAAGDATGGADWGLGVGEGIYPGVKYWVRGAGTVTYNGQTYAGVESGFAAAHFTGAAGARGYTFTGAARVYEYEGILHPDGAYVPKRMSNEWLLWSNGKPYSYEGPDGPINRLHPSLFADFYPYFNGCHFDTREFSILQRPNLFANLFYGQQPISFIEAPDAYNFVEGSNSNAPADFVRSCRIMAPPPEVDSAVSFLDPTVGQEVVKLTFRGRFDTVESAPGSIPRDVGSWDLDNLRQQGPRTMENGIMEYLAALAYTGGDVGGISSTYRCTVKQGDWAVTGSPRDEFGNNLFGACIPHFFAVKLAEEPPEDGNDAQEFLKDADALLDWFVDIEIRDRAMAPGFMDRQTSLAVCDDLTNVMDFTYENLNFQAHGGQWISALPASMIVRGEQQGRADLPMGFGPMGRCICSAETLNQFAANVNLLTRARVMAGAFQARTQTRRGLLAEPISQSWGDNCGASARAEFTGVAFNPDVPLVDDPEQDCDIMEGACNIFATGDVRVTSVGSDGLVATGCNGSGQWSKVSEEQRTRWRLNPVVDLGYAVHPDLAGMVQQSSVFIMGIYTEVRTVVKAIAVSDPADAALCGAGQPDFPNTPFYRDGSGWNADIIEVTNIRECRAFPLEGELKVDDVGSGDALVCTGFTTASSLGTFEGGYGGAVHVTKGISFTTNSVPWLEVELKDYVRGDY